MKIGVLGTGGVGQTLAAKFASLGNDVMMGTRDVEAARVRAEGGFGAVPLSEWLPKHPEVKLGTFAEAAAHGEVLVSATNGAASLDALKLAGPENLDGKLLIDLSNPLDFSEGFPPLLTVCNTDSLGEQIQRAFPGAKVVKTLNTVNMEVMVDPARVAGGDHHVFVSGEDAGAKAQVTKILEEWGWRDVIDLGGIRSARGVEMLLPFWAHLVGALGTYMLNVKVVR